MLKNSISAGIPDNLFIAIRHVVTCRTCPQRIHYRKSFAAQNVRKKNSSRINLCGAVCMAASGGSASMGTVRAEEGDIVTLTWRCLDDDGNVIGDSDEGEEPTTFEVGAGDIVGNRLFEAFDEAIRGVAVGEMVRIKASGGEWNQDLLFKIPREHEEIQRLEGRYKSQGGLEPGMIVELSNKSVAFVAQMDDSTVTLDCNSMMAGKEFTIELELTDLEKSS